jgi:hypothetical protein
MATYTRLARRTASGSNPVVYFKGDLYYPTTNTHIIAGQVILVQPVPGTRPKCIKVASHSSAAWETWKAK